MTLRAFPVTHRTGLAARLYEWHLRQQQLADELGVTPSMVSRWCSGQSPIPPARLTEIARLLDTTEDALT